MRPLLCLFVATLAAVSASCKDDPPPASPPAPVCGNGLVEMAETCEGMPPPMGCNAESCTIEMGWTCTPDLSAPADETSSGGTTGPMEVMSMCERVYICGDGMIDPEEDCDDNNMTVMDGCSGCRIDPLYVCTGQPSECHTCGDGFKNAGEECDDGELIDYNSPGCANCMIIPGWECFPGRVADLCGPVCGDGMWFDTSIEGVTIGFAEQCDDGNLVDGDGCDGNCDIEDGWECDSEAPEMSVCIIPEVTTGTDTDTDTDTDGTSGTDTGSSSGSDTGTGTTGGSSSSG
jgi:large repetitive protein